MNEINVNEVTSGGAQPPRRPGNWPLYVFIAILAVLIVAALVFAFLRRNHAGGPISATATPGVGTTATVLASTHASATRSPRVTRTPMPTRTPVPARPSNPTSLSVANGSCTTRRISWTWTAPPHTTAYDVTVYDARTGHAISHAQTAATQFSIVLSPGTKAGLRVRGRNASGVAPAATSSSSWIGGVPAQTTNPTRITVTTGGPSIIWAWSGGHNASSYKVRVFHYHGHDVREDAAGSTSDMRWETARAITGLTYYMQVRSVGSCLALGQGTPVSARGRLVRTGSSPTATAATTRVAPTSSSTPAKTPLSASTSSPVPSASPAVNGTPPAVVGTVVQ